MTTRPPSQFRFPLKFQGFAASSESHPFYCPAHILADSLLGEFFAMKILHLLSQRPDFTGSGIYLQNIMSEAHNKGHQNFLIAGVPAAGPSLPPALTKESCRFVTFSGGDLPYAVAGMSDVMPYQSSRFRDLDTKAIESYQKAFAKQIKNGLEAWEPDIIHSHHLWLMSATARLTAPHLPMVTTCHSTDLRQFINCPHLRSRVEEPCRGIDRVMSLSKQQARAISKLYGIGSDRITVTGGGFKSELFFPREKPTPPPVQIIYAGKLSRAKGVPWLLQSLTRLPQLPIHLHLVGQGTGQEDEECRLLAGQLQCPVTLHGRVAQESLAKLMGKSHLFVLPSFFEGLPLVLLEALASGCRVITTDLPGCRELLNDADPDMVELVALPPMDEVDNPNPEDMGQLTATLAAALERMVQRILQTPNLKNDAISTITTQYSWPAIFNTVEAVYRKVQQEAGRR